MASHSLLAAYRGASDQLRQLTEVAEARDTEAAWEPLAAICHNLGFDYSGVGLISVMDASADLSLEHATPFFLQSFKRYYDTALHLNDPAAARLAAGARVIIASEVFDKASGNFREGARKVREHFAKDAIAGHAALRIDLPHHKFASFLGVGNRVGESESGFRARVAEHAGLLGVAAAAYTSVAARNLVGPQTAELLTEKEARCLTLLAKGLSAKEIAEEEERSLATIRNRIRSAQRRLHARSAIHAVAIAQHLGAIRM